MVHTPAIAKQGKLPIPALPVAAHTTKQAKQRKRLKEKKESCSEKKKERSRASVVTSIGGRGLLTAKCTDLANTTLTAA